MTSSFPLNSEPMESKAFVSEYFSAMLCLRFLIIEMFALFVRPTDAATALTNTEILPGKFVCFIFQFHWNIGLDLGCPLKGWWTFKIIFQFLCYFITKFFIRIQYRHFNKYLNKILVKKIIKTVICFLKYF